MLSKIDECRSRTLNEKDISQYLIGALQITHNDTQVQKSGMRMRWLRKKFGSGTSSLDCGKGSDGDSDAWRLFSVFVLRFGQVCISGPRGIRRELQSREALPVVKGLYWLRKSQANYGTKNWWELSLPWLLCKVTAILELTTKDIIYLAIYLRARHPRSSELSRPIPRVPAWSSGILRNHLHRPHHRDTKQ